MNLVEPSIARSMAAAESIKKETPFSGNVDVAGSSISRGDTIEIANKKGEMVRYTVTDIKFDKGPARLLLQSIDSKKRTFKDLDTLNKNPELFRKVDTKKLVDSILEGTLDTTAADSRTLEEQNIRKLQQEYAAVIEPTLDTAFDSIRSEKHTTQPKDTKKLVDSILEGTTDKGTSIAHVQQELGNFASIAKSTPDKTTSLAQVAQELKNFVSIAQREAEHIDTLRETIARMLTPEQRKQVQAYAEQTKQTSILKHRNGYRFLWDEMQNTHDDTDHVRTVSPAEGLTDKQTAAQIAAVDTSLRKAGFREMTPADLQALEFEEGGEEKEGDISSTATVPTESLSAQNLAELSELERTTMAEAEIARLRAAHTHVRNVDFVPTKSISRPETFQKPTAERIKNVIAGTETTLYQSTPGAVAAAKKNIARAQLGDRPQITVTPDEFSTSFRATTVALDAQKAQATASLFGKIAAGIRNLFGRQTELPTGASLSRAVYTPNTTPMSQVQKEINMMTTLLTPDERKMGQRKDLAAAAKGITDDTIDRAFDTIQQSTEAQRTALAEAEITAMRAARKNKTPAPKNRNPQDTDNDMLQAAE